MFMLVACHEFKISPPTHPTKVILSALSQSLSTRSMNEMNACNKQNKSRIKRLQQVAAIKISVLSKFRKCSSSGDYFVYESRDD